MKVSGTYQQLKLSRRQSFNTKNQHRGLKSNASFAFAVNLTKSNIQHIQKLFLHVQNGSICVSFFFFHEPNTACCVEMSGLSLSRHQAVEVTPQQLREEEIMPVCIPVHAHVCVCVCVFYKKQRLCIVISNWVNVASCVCIHGCHGIEDLSFNPRTH